MLEKSCAMLSRASCKMDPRTIFVDETCFGRVVTLGDGWKNMPGSNGVASTRDNLDPWKLILVYRMLERGGRHGWNGETELLEECDGGGISRWRGKWNSHGSVFVKERGYVMRVILQNMRY